MKKIKETQADQFYLFAGKSNANSCFIEKLDHGRTFLRYANYFLKDFVQVYDYVLTRDGWYLVLQINSRDEISRFLGRDNFDIWRVISEQMRKFLSTFVTVTNREKGRTGCLVHSTYERYYFESLDEAISVINGVRQQRIKIYRGKKKYRGLKVHYEICRTIGKGSIFICSRDIRRSKKRVRDFEKVLCLRALTNSVLQNLVKNTISSHNHSKTPSSTYSPLII